MLLVTFRPLWLLLFGLFGIVLNATACGPDQPLAYEKHYKEIKYAELRKAIDAGEVFIIDSNSAETFSKEHLATAVSIADKKKLEMNLPYLKSYPIVVYCGGPQCTAWHEAADFAAARDYTNVRHYKGGLKDWKSQGDKLSKGKN